MRLWSLFLPLFFVAGFAGAGFGPALNAQTNIAFRSSMTFPNQRLANIWGYSSGGNEYALVGARNGMIVVDVTDPENPTEIVQIPGPMNNWREIKTYQHYAYVATEGGGGLQIVDLTNLPGSNLDYHSYTGNGPITGLSSIHALHVDETKGYLYLYGTNKDFGKPLALNLNNDPYNPTYASTVHFFGYAHDGYADNDMLFAAHIYEGLFSVVDMTNKATPALLASQPTPGDFTHNTWRNGNTLFTTDEVSNSFLTAYDISNLGNITLLDKIQSNPGSGSVVHNTHILNDFAVTSWYKDGLTIVDVSRPANLVQVGNYDTYSGAGSGFSGCWGVYPYFPSGTIVASNILADGSTTNGEMFVLTPTYVRACHFEGLVTDFTTGFPLPGVKVQLAGTATPAETTGANGLYKMGQLDPGTFLAKFSKPGYQEHTTSVTLSNGALTELNVALLPVGLPVELVRFDAAPDGPDAAVLTWETAAEENNAGFEIEHSADGVDFRRAGFVEARGPGTPYRFRLDGLAPGRHFFRLRQLDHGGAATYSPVRALSFRPAALRAELRPNAVGGGRPVLLLLHAPQAGRARVEIHDAFGRSAGPAQSVELGEDAVQTTLYAPRSPGLYYVNVQTAAERAVLRLVVE
jgi:choice-of-anchor B domain-containing protein